MIGTDSESTSAIPGKAVVNPMTPHPEREHENASQNACGRDGDFQSAKFHSLTPQRNAPYALQQGIANRF